MASRGTLQRDGQAEQRSSWAGPTAPSGRRPPSAPRERKPALAALAILLIAGGALGAGYLVLNNSKRVEAIEVNSVIVAGQKIPLSALTEVQVPQNTNLQFVPWTEVQQVTHYYAKTNLYQGTLLTSPMTEPSNSATNGDLQFGLALKDGQYPDQMQVGDEVSLWVDQSPPAGCSGLGLLTMKAVVLAENSPPSGGSNLDVIVGVASTIPDPFQITCNAAAGNVSVVVLPAAGATTSGQTQSTNKTSSPKSTHSQAAPNGHQSSTPTTSKH
jgi:hypothetical protein